MVNSDRLKILVEVGWFDRPHKATRFPGAIQTTRACIAFGKVATDSTSTMFPPICLVCKRVDRKVIRALLARIAPVVGLKIETYFNSCSSVRYDQCLQNIHIFKREALDHAISYLSCTFNSHADVSSSRVDCFGLNQMVVYPWNFCRADDMSPCWC